MQPDPIGYGDGDGMNMYAYVGGDPINATDPTGLSSNDDWKSNIRGCRVGPCNNVQIASASGSTSGGDTDGTCPNDICLNLTSGMSFSVGEGAIPKLNLLNKAINTLVPGAYFSGIAQTEFANGNYLNSALYTGAALVEAAISLLPASYFTRPAAVGRLFKTNITPTSASLPTEITLTKTVERELATRPYLESPSLVREILSSGASRPDPQGVPGIVRYDVPGTLFKPGPTGAGSGRTIDGVFELNYSPSTNTIYHFQFTTKKP